MKKLLILLLLSPMFLFSQKKVTIKGTQLSISSLAPMASFSIVANATGSPATPTAVPLAIGLKFYPGVGLGIDTANFKDTIFAVNGLQIIGASFNTIGLGGRLQQATNISLANLYSLTIDSAQTGAGKGFRVNYGSDAGWDISVRDSATGFWTRVGKGNPGDVLTMLSAGGIGWGPGGGGGAADVVTTYSSGTTLTQGSGANYIQVNPASLQATLTVTTLASGGTWHSSNNLFIKFGGLITNGSPVITSFTLTPGSGLTVVWSTDPSGLTYYTGNTISIHKIGTILYVSTIN